MQRTDKIVYDTFNSYWHIAINCIQSSLNTSVIRIFFLCLEVFYVVFVDIQLKKDISKIVFYFPWDTSSYRDSPIALCNRYWVIILQRTQYLRSMYDFSKFIIINNLFKSRELCVHIIIIRIIKSCQSCLQIWKFS